MSLNLKELYTAYATAYSKDMSSQVKWIAPKIYHGGNSFDLSKRWYVYYSFVDPATGVMKRQPPVTMEINRKFKTKADRIKHLKILKQVIQDALKQGFSPYESNIEELQYSASTAINAALELKLLTLKSNSGSDYTIRVNSFLEYLKTIGKDQIDIRMIDKKTVNSYLNLVLQKTAPRNRNNTKSVLSSIFTTLVSQEFIDHNFIKSDIAKIKERSKRDKTIGSEELELILSHLGESDHLLLLFIQFVSFFFFRPVEVVRLKVENINLKDRLIVDEIKQSTMKTKIIPDIIFNQLQAYLNKYPNKKQSDFLFTPDGIGEWTTNETNRRNYFSKRFKNLRIEKNISDDVKVYSFRHTYITMAYRKLRQQFDKETTLSKLMLITGHTSEAIHEYIHVLDAELPEDYSHLLE